MVKKNNDRGSSILNWSKCNGGSTGSRSVKKRILKNKRELLEPTHDRRILRKILLTDWHDHFIDQKCYFLRFLAAHTSSHCNLTRMIHEVIFSTNL